MAIVHRRVFYAKVGKSDQLAELLKETNDAMSRFGTVTKGRVLTDYLSGRTDRVVMEWEVGSIGELESVMEAAMTSPEGQAWFNDFFQRLADLIHYADVENWTIK